MAVANIPEQKYGGYEHDFINAVPDRLVCSTVCTKVLTDPHLTSCCGLHVCETCLNNWFEKHREKSCPHCRAKKEKFNHFLDKKLKREIAELKIRCIHKAKGCQWTGELEKLDNHIQSDSGCGFVKVKCPNSRHGFVRFYYANKSPDKCSKMFRKDLHEHINNKCMYRSVICTHCKERQQYFYLLEDHYTSCSQYPLPCPNRCGADIPPEKVTTHRDECPLEPVQCPFAEAGCQTRLVRNQLEKHTVNNQQTHILQLMADYSKTKEDLTKTQQALTITQGRLESMQEGISRELQNIKVTKDLEPILKSIQTNNLGSRNVINEDGQEHGLQFSIPGESYFNNNKVWYSPAFYVKTFKTCVQAKLNMETGEINWSLVVLGTERTRCGDVLEGEIEGSLTIHFCLPCVNNPSEMYMHNIISASCSGKLVPKKPQALTVYISDHKLLLCHEH